MNSITINSKLVSDYRIEYEYEIKGEWKKNFTQKKFYVEYSHSINSINDSIAIIPILGTVLPMSWLFNAQVKVNEIDKMFFEAIPDFKRGYENMYPQLSFGGNLVVDHIVENKNSANKSAAMFSGGVDAFNTLISHIVEKPDIITIWGADIAVSNDEGWSVVEKHRDEVAKKWDLGAVTVKSSFREAVNEEELSRYILRSVNESWWHGFHHSIGMFALVAPVAYCRNYSHLYIASSFTADYIGKYTCASDPTIDNFVKFCGCSVVHDGYEFNRQEKIHNICEYSSIHNVKIPLRVCWESTGGSNCCKCEKCLRTMMGIYAEKKDITDFGFSCKKIDNYILRKMLGQCFANAKTAIMRYECIQKRMRENYSKNEIDTSLRWFYKTDVDKLIKRFKWEYKLKGNILRIIHKIEKLFGIKVIR